MSAKVIKIKDLINKNFDESINILQRLKFIKLFLYNLSKIHYGILIWLIINISVFIIGLNISPNVKSFNIKKEVKIENKYLYIYEKAIESKIDYDIISSDVELEIKDGIYKKSKMSDIKVALVSLSIVSAFILFLHIIMEGLEIDNANYEALSSLISCEIENEKFYYISCGRLIGIRNEIINQKYCQISREFGINNFEKIRRCPVFKTKQQKREFILNKIL